MQIACPPIGMADNHIHKSEGDRYEIKGPSVQGISRIENKPTEPNTTKRRKKGSDRCVKKGTSESSRPKPAAPATASKIPGCEKSAFVLGQPIKVIERVARATAIQIDGVKLLGVRLNVATNIATNTGFEPIIGVIRLASPLFKDRKQSICERKKSNPSKDP